MQDQTWNRAQEQTWHRSCLRPFGWARVNGVLCRIITYPANKRINKPVLDVVHPDYREVVPANLGRIRDGEADSYEAESGYLRKGGIHVPISVIRNGDGSVCYFVGMFEDISARKEVEQLLQRQADR